MAVITQSVRQYAWDHLYKSEQEVIEQIRSGKLDGFENNGEWFVRYEAAVTTPSIGIIKRGVRFIVGALMPVLPNKISAWKLSNKIAAGLLAFASIFWVLFFLMVFFERLFSNEPKLYSSNISHDIFVSFATVVYQWPIFLVGVLVWGVVKVYELNRERNQKIRLTTPMILPNKISAWKLSNKIAAGLLAFASISWVLFFLMVSFVGILSMGSPGIHMGIGEEIGASLFLASKFLWPIYLVGVLVWGVVKLYELYWQHNQ